MDRAGLIALYDCLIRPHDGVARKGKKTPYTALNGNMFSFVDPEDRLCIRLSQEDRAAWAQAWPDDPVMQYGRVMRGYVTVPEALLADEDELAGWFSRSVEGARALKPKPTRRKKRELRRHISRMSPKTGAHHETDFFGRSGGVGTGSATSG